MAALFLIGCGGGGGGVQGRGEIAGVVLDANNQPVRDARVWTDAGNGNRETHTNSAGSYVLTNVGDTDTIVHAEVRDSNNVRSAGQNLARVFNGERASSTNIVVYRASELVRLNGQVRNSSGRVLRGARVFARATDGTVLSSASALTDNDGVYVIDDLHANTEYQLVANTPGYGEASDVITIQSGEARHDFVLGAPSDPDLDTPAGLVAVAYTTPEIPTTRGTSATQLAGAFEALKQHLDPTRAKRLSKLKKRDTLLGSPIEVDLTWDPYPIPDTLGFAVYRQPVGSSNDDTVQFLHDPLAEIFVDADPLIRETTAYNYQITALSTSYDAVSGHGESVFSNSVEVQPLPELALHFPSGKTLSWSAVSGAADYSVFVYDRYPRIGVDPIYDNNATPTTSTEFTVPVSLTAGQTYYYIVVGHRADDSAMTFSTVDTFTP